MSIVITDLGSDIQFAFTGKIASEKYVFNKSTMRVKQGASLVYVTNSDSFQAGKDNKVIELDYTKVTSPVYVSNDALVTGLKTMIDDNASSVDDRAYDPSGDQDVVFVTNSLPSHETSPELLVSATNLVASTYRYIAPMGTYKDGVLHWDLVGSATDTVTITVWGTLKSAANDTADTDWVDMSTDFLGAASKASVSATPEEGLFVFTNKPVLKIMVKVVVTGGTTNTVDIYIKKKG